MNVKIQEGIDQLFNNNIVENNEQLGEYLIKTKRVNKQTLGIWLSEVKNNEIL